jgi:hypothetical protein
VGRCYPPPLGFLILALALAGCSRPQSAAHAFRRPPPLPVAGMLTMLCVQEEWANVFLLAFAGFIGERGSALRVIVS